MPSPAFQQFFESKSSLIGHVVALKTTLGEDIQGELFNYDMKSNCITLKEPAELPQRTYRVLNTNFIANISSVSSPSSNSSLEVPTVNMDKIKAFETKSLRSAAQDASKIGVGVSKQAQQLFDALSKTYRCAWKGKNILMVDTEIQIEPPYTAESCFGPSTAVARVKRVVHGERMKIESGNW